jgi:hypothetical protein
VSATTAKQPPRRLSEEERYRRLETRVLNRVKAWDQNAERRRHDVVEFLRDAIDELEVYAPDGDMEGVRAGSRRWAFKARDRMYRYWMELEEIRRREDGRDA